MPVPLYELTAHAATVMAEREIDAAWLELALAWPERTEADRFDASLVHALRRVPEFGDRVLRVVYNPAHKPPRVITLYFDRRQRGKP
jgi:Domain of unknown function (DUF4258)